MIFYIIIDKHKTSVAILEIPEHTKLFLTLFGYFYFKISYAPFHAIFVRFGICKQVVLNHGF